MNEDNNDSPFGSYSTKTIVVAFLIVFTLIVHAYIGQSVYQDYNKWRIKLERVHACQSDGVNPNEVANCIKVVTDNNNGR